MSDLIVDRRARRAAALAVAIGGLAVAPAPAAAQVIELGQTSSAPVIVPTCPTNVAAKNCTIILTKSTGLATVHDGTTGPTIAKRGGDIVAFTVGLSRLSPKLKTATAIVHAQDSEWGGTTQVGLTIMKPVGPKSKFEWQLISWSPLVHVQPYLGTVTQFVLPRPLPIKRGEAVGINVPTWAPILSIGLDAKTYGYRQNRTKGCDGPSTTNVAMFTLSATSVFGCKYAGVIPEYSATEISTAAPPKQQIGGTTTPEQRRLAQRATTRRAWRITRRLERRGPKVLARQPY